MAPHAHNLVQQVCGFQESEITQFSMQLTAFKNSLKTFDEHLKLRNYLVGYSMTLADVYLLTVLISPYQLVLDKKSRDSLPSLTRFVTLNLQSLALQKCFGKIQLCAKAINPVFGLKIEKPKKEEEKGGKKDAGGKKAEKKPSGKSEKPAA